MLAKDQKDLRKIHKLINSDTKKIEIAWLPKGTLGENHYNKIIIDPFQDLLDTLIHEYLHDIYPKKRDKTITYMASRILKSMSLRQKKHLLNKFHQRASPNHKNYNDKKE